MFMKAYYIIILFLLGFVGSVQSACDYTSSDPIVITPSGTHNMMAGYTQMYVLTDFNGDIIAVNATGNFGTQNFGTYNVYAINYEDASPPTIPAIGLNISNINTGCVDISTALPITVCETSVDSVCEDSGNDIVLAMNADFNFAADYNQIMVIVDNATGNIISIKVLDLTTGMVSYTTTAVTGELTLGDYTAYAVNYQDPETLASLGLSIGTSWSGVFGASCADASAGNLIQVDQCCGADVGVLNASTAGSTNNNGAPVNEFILCDNDHFLLDTVSGYSAAIGANPALDYAIYICSPTSGVEPDNDPCFSGAYIETPPSVDEINNGGINSNIITYLNGIGQTVTNNTVWIVPQTLSISALNANQYDPLCYDLGTPYKVTYLNPITTTEVEDCPAGTVVVTISGGYPEFFTGNYNITNTGDGTLSSTTVNAHGGTVTISGLTFGDSYSFTILDDNNCPVTYAGAAFPNCACPADVGDIVVAGNGTLVGTNEFDLTDCETITFTASNEDLNSGALTYGWAVFSCEPTLPFTAAEILDFNNHPCYLGQSTGLTTSDTDAGGISGGIPGGFDTLYVVPYTSETSLAGSLDDDADGCYDYGDVYQINYIAPTCGDCAAPTCAIGSVTEFADRTYLQCDDPCADLNDLTHVTYHTLTTDAFGNVGVVQQLSFDQILCSGITRSAVLRDDGNACAGADILPTTANANAVGSGFNPEWIGLTPNTNYTLIITTVIGSNCNYDFGCVDFYGIPGCVVDIGNTTAITTDNTNNDYVLCFNEEIDLSTTAYTLPSGYASASIGYALYSCAPTTNDPATDPCFTGQYVVGDAANSVNDGTFAPALAAVNQTVWLVPITMDTTVAPIFDYDFDNDGCYAMGTPIEITYLNAIDTIVTQNCGAGEITVQISGGYPEFFTGNYNITNNGAGTLDATILATHNGVVTLSGLTNGMNYDISIVDDNACTITNVIGTYISAIIDSVPFVDAGCNNNDGQLEIFASNTVGNVDYLVNGVVQSNNGLFTGLSAGSYFVQIADDNGCIDSSTVNIAAALPITFDVDSIDVLCFGDLTGSITFSNASGGDGTYNYSIDNGITPQISSVFNGLGANSFQLIVTDNSGCSLDSTISINQPALLDIDNFVIVDPSCSGSLDGVVTASLVGGASTYTYNWSNALAGVNDDQATNVGAGTYSLTVTDQNGCTADTLNFVVAEPAPISVNSITVTDELCVGQCDGTIIVDSPNATLYGINNGVLGAVNQFSNLCNGVYTIQLSNAAGCTFDTNATIGSPLPIVVTSAVDQIICIGQNINLGVTSVGGTGTIIYTWDNGAGVGQTPNVSPVVTTVFSVSATDDNGCPSNMDSQVITLNDPLSVVAFNDTTICEGNSANIHAIATGGDGNYTYVWDNSAGVGASVNVSPNGTSIYTVTVSDGCNSPNVNDNVSVTIQNLPNSSFTGNFRACDIVNASFIANDLNNPNLYNASFEWSFGNGDFTNSRDLVNYSYTNPGCYDVSYTITDSVGCISSDTLFDAVCVYETPTADFSYSPEAIDLLNPQVEFSDESIGDNLVYYWTFDPNVIPASSSEVNPTIDFPDTQTGTYTACLTVIDNQTSCPSSICKEVIIGGVLFFYIPNAFSPDDDGVNETFKPSIYGVDIEEYTFMIYDRWGELIFESQNLSNGWDGHYKSENEVKQDVYVWKLRFHDPTTDKVINKVGHVSLIK